MKVVKAPHKFTPLNRFSVFLAGSIEMGKAENWQEILTQKLSKEDIIILNPRRDDWDSTWKQTKDNPQFREQVEWELKAQEDANIIAMYFDPKTQSPITLLELGLFRSNRLIVCCSEGYYRKGNVDIVCERYGIAQVGSLDALASAIIQRIYSDLQLNYLKTSTVAEASTTITIEGHECFYQK